MDSSGKTGAKTGEKAISKTVAKTKRDLLQIRDAALEAVNPAQAVRRYMARQGTRLHFNTQVWDMEGVDRVFIVAAGKAAMPMVEAAVDILGEHLAAGVVVTKYEHAARHALPPTIQVFEAGHPIPDMAGVRGTERAIDLLEGLTARDRVLVLLSGGGSALLVAPATGLSLDDLQATTDLLLRSGATIDELNAVRKHLSRVKGGQLARLAAPAPLGALILSDVVGDPLDVIASGPTSPDPTTYTQAWDVLAKRDLLEALPASVETRLRDGKAGRLPETPKPGNSLFSSVTNIIVGSNRLAAEAAVAKAEQLNYQTLLLTTFVEGEAREVAKVAAALAKGVRVHGDPLSPPACLVWGGETTVTVRGQGKGGRNQELALAAALALDGWPGVALMALATDGTDGPTDGAGAIVDGQTIQAARSQGLDPWRALTDNDAYPLLEAVDALMRTGPTGTNVNDLLVILVSK